MCGGFARRFSRYRHYPRGRLRDDFRPLNSSRRGHSVTVVKSGEGAISALRDSHFDLLLTDLHMPGLDGIETARSIRAGKDEHSTRSMPIVALTADVLDTTRRACQDAGMDGLLTKPIAPAELDCMIARLFSDNVLVAAE